MTVLQVEYRSGAIVLVEAHRPRPPSSALDRETHLRSIPPLLDRLDNLGVADVELGDPPQRLPHDRLLGSELRFVGDVLQLAAAAMILHVVGARCGNAGRPGGDDLGQLPAGEALVQLHTLAQPDPLARSGAGDEHGAPVRQPAHALPPAAIAVIATTSLIGPTLPGAPRAARLTGGRAVGRSAVRAVPWPAVPRRGARPPRRAAASARQAPRRPGDGRRRARGR